MARWCPTQEQVMVLEEIYNKGGIKTPNAFQIQQITTHLSFYGKIEGKNVFYWFQNHKARERQKLRRKLMQNHKQHHLSLQQRQPFWYPYSAAHSVFHQGRRAEGAGHHGGRFTVPQSSTGPCTIRQEAPIKTLELFPLKSSSHLLNNSNQNPIKEPTSS